jgi:hypothetical protein
MAVKSEKTFDKRTIGRYITKGQVSQKDYDAYLKALPDEEANGEWVKLDLVDAEITDDSIDEDSTDEENETY